MESSHPAKNKMMHYCSILICTCDRESDLQERLADFRKLTVPDDYQVEIIIVNNSKKELSLHCDLGLEWPRITVKKIHCLEAGKSHALNAGIAIATGTVILFLDDDVEIPADWLLRMAGPLLRDEADAVVSRVVLADDLKRSWMEPMHETWLAVGNDIYQDDPELIGASMGVHRSVFDQISGYDVELGPGKLGFGEDTLLWLQMKQLKMKIHAVSDLEVIHHPSASRLLRKSWISGAKQRGATEAYLLHHWKHESIPLAFLHLLINQFKLKVRRLFSKRAAMDSEGCPAWEMSYESRVALITSFLEETKKARKYSHR